MHGGAGRLSVTTSLPSCYIPHAGLQAEQCVHDHTGFTGEHGGRPVEDGVGDEQPHHRHAVRSA